MKIKQMYLTRKNPEKIFKLLKEELIKQPNTQVFIEEDIFQKLFFGWEMHVYQTHYQKSFHYNYEQDSLDGETWLKLTKGNAHAETVAMASFITNCEGYKQLVQFNSQGVCYTHYCTGFEQLLLIMFEPAN